MQQNEPRKFNPNDGKDVSITLCEFPTEAASFTDFPTGRIVIGGHGSDEKIVFYRLHVALTSRNRRNTGEVQAFAKRLLIEKLQAAGHLPSSSKKEDFPPSYGMKTLAGLVHYQLWGVYTTTQENTKRLTDDFTRIGAAIKLGDVSRGPNVVIQLADLIQFKMLSYDPDNRQHFPIDPNDVCGTIEFKRDGVNFMEVPFILKAKELQRWNKVPFVSSELADQFNARRKEGELPPPWEYNLRAGMRDGMIVEQLRKAIYDNYPFMQGANLIGEIKLK